MPDQTTAEQNHVERRSLIGQFGAAAVTVLAAGAAATGAAVVNSAPAAAQSYTDADILNFALNLEYLEGEYYIRGLLGRGLDATDVSDPNGVGNAGFVLGGALVPFQTPVVAGAIQRITVDEVDHIRFIRRVLGNQAVARPNIDLLNSFNAVAVAAGLIPAGTQFDPFLNETNFLIGALSLTDVGVTAYAGAARLLQSKDNLDAAASILAAEAYHAGSLRTLLCLFGQQNVFNAISAVRARLGNGKDQGLSIPNFPDNIAPVDGDGLVYRRTAGEVLGIVYNGVPSGGGFFPDRANGTIR